MIFRPSTLTRIGALLASRDTDWSSLALIGLAFGADIKSPSHPDNALDLGRCIRLLQCLETWDDRFTILTRAAERSKEWALIKENWPTLYKSYQAELPTGTFVETDTLMQALLP